MRFPRQPLSITTAFRSSPRQLPPRALPLQNDPGPSQQTVLKDCTSSATRINQPRAQKTSCFYKGKPGQTSQIERPIRCSRQHFVPLHKYLDQYPPYRGSPGHLKVTSPRNTSHPQTTLTYRMIEADDVAQRRQTVTNDRERKRMHNVRSVYAEMESIVSSTHKNDILLHVHFLSGPFKQNQAFPSTVPFGTPFISRLK